MGAVGGSDEEWNVSEGVVVERWDDGLVRGTGTWRWRSG